MRILVVDDERWWIDLYKKTLEKEGHTVYLALSAQDALESIDGQTPDVILLDFMMPGGNAMVLLHELQTYADTKKIPVILSTSLSHAKNIAVDFEKYGVRSVLDKATVTPKKLKEAIGAVQV